MKWPWKLKHGKAIGPFYMSMKWKLKHKKPIDPLLYVYDVWKIPKIPLTSSTIHIITIIVNLCVICIVMLNHVAKLLCIILYINSLGLPVCDVTFCCIIIFYVSAAEPAIGKSIFVWNWHPRETRLISTQLSVRPFVRLWQGIPTN